MNDIIIPQLKSLRAAVGEHRKRLGAAAADDLPYALSAAHRVGLDIRVEEDGYRWELTHHGSLLLHFWPSRRHAKKIAGPEFTCKGWEHAISEALRISMLLDRHTPDRRDLD